MNQQQQREIALGATRSEARRQHFDVDTLSANDALAILDDLLRKEPDLIASKWYAQASDNQIKSFKREWKARQ